MSLIESVISFLVDFVFFFDLNLSFFLIFWGPTITITAAISPRGPGKRKSSKIAKMGFAHQLLIVKPW